MEGIAELSGLQCDSVGNRANVEPLAHSMQEYRIGDIDMKAAPPLRIGKHEK